MFNFLILPNKFNEELKENEFSESLRALIFGDDFNQEIKKNILPANLLVLVFGDGFNKKLNKDILPANLKMLELGFGYSAKIDDYALPKKLEILIINYQTFNSLIVLPKTLKYLEILETGYNRQFAVDEIIYELIPDFLEYLVLNLSTITFKNKNISSKNYGILLQEKFKNLKYLSIDGNNKQLNILNNLPLNLFVIKFTDLGVQLTNLPFNLKEIYLIGELDKNFVEKIPFGCDVIIYKNNILYKNNANVIKNYLEILTHSSTSYPDSIFNNILKLDE